MGVLEQRMGEPVRMDGLKVIATVALFMLFSQQVNVFLHDTGKAFDLMYQVETLTFKDFIEPIVLQ